MKPMAEERKWYTYMWIIELTYLCLGTINILFAWLGIIFFFTPLLIALIGGSKIYCQKYCGRGQLLQFIGKKVGISLNKTPPRFLRSLAFRYGFLAFFMTMFGLMLYHTVLVFKGAPLSESITLLWLFKLPWNWSDISFVSPGIAQFAFGFYSVMLTSSILGLGTMLIFRPRTWCVYCPMGTMTQGICHLKKQTRNS